jgi:5'-3' exoribonuclease 2
MAVLPEDSAHAIPKASRWLMCDAESPIIDFYPKEVPVDPNGKAMPWLWVVLLPFIDEERLLAAMNPTMKEWTKQDLLCNARGIDNGYVYVSNKSPLVDKISTIYNDPGKYKTSKMRLTDATSYSIAGFFGSIRLPLSNEVYPIEGDVKIDPPSSASKLHYSDFDGTFSDPVDPNEAVCVAFTEPPKLSHKSVVLPGAKPCKPILKPEDRRIRRPRLNRGGSTIANLGVSNGASHQSGYGSMNISSYERNLAVQGGRGHQLHQAGTRAWGAMEPTPKRHRQQQQQHPPYPSNPFNQGLPQNRQQGMPQNTGPPWQQPGYNQWQQQNATQGSPFNSQGQQHGYGQQQQGYGYQQQQRPPYNQRGGYQQRPPPPPPPGRQQQHSFQGYNRSSPPGQQPWQSGGGGGYRQPPQQHQPTRVNPNVMNNLRSQLANTLQQNRRGGRQGGNQR